MAKTVGVTVGKFMPLHKGHELMFGVANDLLDELVIIVSGNESDEIPLSVRYKWVSKFSSDTVRVVKHIDDIPMGEKDENGTVINDNKFWNEWISVFKTAAPDATHFVSSDLYGQKAAELMGIDWLPIDPKRETVPISGTKIRENPFDNFKYLSEYAKPYFLKHIAIIGPESTGKSTLTKDLSDIFDIPFAHEYGRTISEAKLNDLNETDFEYIFFGQEKLIRHISRDVEYGAVLTDTEGFTTYLFSELYLDKPMKRLEHLSKYQIFDLYLLLAPTVKWVDDGTRVMPDQVKRENFFNRLKDFLDKNNKNYVIIDDIYYSDRLRHSIKAVEKLLYKETTNE